MESPPSSPASSVPRRVLNVSSLFWCGNAHYLVQLGSDSITWRRQAGSGRTHSLPFVNVLDVRWDPSRNGATFQLFYCLVPEDDTVDVELKSIEFSSLIGVEETSSWVETIRGRIFPAKRQGSQKRNITVLINPFGGTGSGRSIWQTVFPIFKAAPIELTVIETTAAGFGENFAKTSTLENMIDGIITVSGDGLLNEVVNGLLKRADWDTARRIPIGVIPAGSGNGISAAVGAFTPKRAAFHIAKGFTTPLDVWSILSLQKRMYGILSIEWALLAAVDFESESIRFLGGARFTLWAVKKVVDGETHSGLLAWTDQPPIEEDAAARISNVDSNAEESLRLGPPLLYLPVKDLSNWKGAAGDFVFFLACNVTHISTDVNAAPKAVFADGYADLLMMRGGSRADLMKFLLDFNTSGQHAAHPNLQYVKAKAFVLRPAPHKGNVLLGVDGELMDPSLDVQVEVHQGLCSIFAAPKFARPN